MKTTFLLACVVPLAVATRNAADIKYALPKGLSAESSACEFPGSYTIQNLVAVGNVANNFTNVTEVFFGFTDSETGLTSSCEMNSTSTNLAPGGAYAQYDCDDSNLKFSWGSTTTTGMSYKLAITEVICNATYEVSGSWIPDFTCQDCASGTEVECKPSGNATSYTEKFSGLDPVIN